MRKSFQTIEYGNVPRPGTLTVPERRHFFGGKIMEIEDEIRIESNSFQHQLKKLNKVGPTLLTDQSNSELQNAARWELTVDINKILEDFLYNELLAENINQDFRALNEANLPTQRLSDTVLAYVRQNLLSRYQFTKLVLWVKYYDLSTQGPITGSTPERLLQYVPIYHFDARPTDEELGDVTRADLDFNKLRDNKGISVQLSYTTDKRLKLQFKQEKAARFFTFAYYFDVVYTKV